MNISHVHIDINSVYVMYNRIVYVNRIKIENFRLSWQLKRQTKRRKRDKNRQHCHETSILNGIFSSVTRRQSHRPLKLKHTKKKEKKLPTTYPICIHNSVWDRLLFAQVVAKTETDSKLETNEREKNFTIWKDKNNKAIMSLECVSIWCRCVCMHCDIVRRRNTCDITALSVSTRKQSTHKWW